MTSRWFVLWFFLLLAACSYDYRVEAVFIDGHVTFIQRQDEKTFAPWCLMNFKVSDVDGTPMWEIDAYDAYREARTCGPFFPMRYGQAPAGAKIVVSARPLVVGRTYVVTGNGRGSLTGVFRYEELRQRKLTTYARDSAESLAAYQRYWPTQRLDLEENAANDTANNSH
jgi:hypothetical protein